MTTTGTVTEEQARALLRGAEAAWRQLDPRALIATLHEDIRIVFNFGEPIIGIDAAAAWIEHRQRTQPDYVLTKQFRGIYGADTIVSQWTGTWTDSAGTPQRGIGIELLTVDGAGLITKWEAVMHAEPR